MISSKCGPYLVEARLITIRSHPNYFEVVLFECCWCCCWCWYLYCCWWCSYCFVALDVYFVVEVTLNVDLSLLLIEVGGKEQTKPKILAEIRLRLGRNRTPVFQFRFRLGRNRNPITNFGLNRKFRPKFWKERHRGQGSLTKSENHKWLI